MKVSNYDKAMKLRAQRSDDPLEDYLSGHSRTLERFKKVTYEDIFNQPFEMGRAVGGLITVLAHIQGFTLHHMGDSVGPEDAMPLDQFGYHPNGSNPPTVFLPKADPVWGNWPDEGAVALAHYFFLWIGMKSENFTCCDPGDLQQPMFSFEHARAVIVEGLKNRNRFVKSINHHWYQASVWSRMFFGTNKIYKGAMAQLIMEEDEKTGWYMPDALHVMSKYPEIPRDQVFSPMERQLAMELVKGEPIVKTK